MAILTRRGTAALVFIVLLAACTRTTAIGDILAHPRDYADRTVTVRGTVAETFSFLVVKYFVLDDGSGRITVVTARPLPAKGEKITVHGTVREAFSLGSDTTLVLLETAPAPGSGTGP